MSDTIKIYVQDNYDASKWSVTKNTYFVDPTVANQGNAATEGSLAYILAYIAALTPANPEATIIIPPTLDNTTLPLSTAVTVPSNVTVKIIPGAILAITAAVAFNGTFVAERRHCFTCTGSGAVTFAAPAVDYACPEWWATNTTPGTTNMATAINAALDSYDVVELGADTYAVSSSIFLANNKTLRGAGMHAPAIKKLVGGSIVSTVVQSSATTIRQIGTTASWVTEGSGSTSGTIASAVITNKEWDDTSDGNYNIHLHDFYLEGLYAPALVEGAVAGILLWRCKDSVIERVKTAFTGHGIGISGLYPDNVTSNNIIRDCEARYACSHNTAGLSGEPRGIITQCDGSSIFNNYTYNCKTGIYCEGDYIKFSGNRMECCVVDPEDTGVDGTIGLMGRYDSTIRTGMICYIVGAGGAGDTTDPIYYQSSYCPKCTNLEVSNNTATSNFGSCFIIAYANNAVVTGNTAIGGTMGYRLHTPQRNVNLVGNYSKGAGNGIRIEQTSYQTEIVAANRLSTTATIKILKPTATAHEYPIGGYVIVEGYDMSTSAEYNGYHQVTGYSTDSTYAYITYEVTGTPADPGDIDALNIDPNDSPNAYTPRIVRVAEALNITGNTIEESYGAGIHLEYIHKSNISDNIVFNCNQVATIQTRGGINLHSYVYHCNLTDNILFDNQETATQVFGVYEFPSSAQWVYDNTSTASGANSARYSININTLTPSFLTYEDSYGNRVVSKTMSPCVDRFDETLPTLDDTGSPSTQDGSIFNSTTTPVEPITYLDGGYAGKEVTILGKNGLCIYDGTTHNYSSSTGGGTAAITSVGTTATVTTSADHGLRTGWLMNISGCNEAGFNLSRVVITVTGVKTFTYTIADLSGISATGTPVASFGGYIYLSGNHDWEMKSQDSLTLTYYTRINGNSYWIEKCRTYAGPITVTNYTNLKDVTNAINTTNKTLGKCVKTTADGKLYFATGKAASDSWVDEYGRELFSTASGYVDNNAMDAVTETISVAGPTAAMTYGTTILDGASADIAVTLAAGVQYGQRKRFVCTSVVGGNPELTISTYAGTGSSAITADFTAAGHYIELEWAGSTTGWILVTLHGMSAPA